MRSSGHTKQRQTYLDIFIFVQKLDPHTISLAMVAALQGTTVQAMLSQKRGNNACFKCGSLGHFKSDCPKNKGAKSGQANRVPGVCPWCRKGNHWARVCKSKSDIPGHPLPGNERRGQPQALRPIHFRLALGTSQQTIMPQPVGNPRKRRTGPVYLHQYNFKT